MRGKPDLRLRTVERVQRLLERAEHPLSRSEILAELARSGHGTTFARLDRALVFFRHLGLGVEGSRGVQWTHNDSPSLQRAVATGKRL